MPFAFSEKKKNNNQKLQICKPQPIKTMERALRKRSGSRERQFSITARRRNLVPSAEIKAEAGGENHLKTCCVATGAKIVASVCAADEKRRIVRGSLHTFPAEG